MNSPTWAQRPAHAGADVFLLEDKPARGLMRATTGYIKYRVWRALGGPVIRPGSGRWVLLAIGEVRSDGT